MKQTFKKTCAIFLLIIGFSASLVGCGTGADSGGMSGSSSLSGALSE